MPWSVQVALAPGHGLQRHGQSLDDEIVERELEGARPLLRGERVEPCAGRHQRVELAIDGEVEMRNGLLGERQPLGDEATHRVVRHDLVRPRLVKREHLAVGEPARLVRLAPRDQLLRARLRRLLALDGLGGSGRGDRFDRLRGLGRSVGRALDIVPDDASMRARAVERRNLEPKFAREPPRQRRGKPAGRVIVAAVPPDLLGDLVHHLLGGQRPLPLRDGRKSALLGVRTLCLGATAMRLILRRGRRPRLEG